MAKKTSIYLTDAAETIIGQTMNLSGRINTIIARYGHITATAAPALTLNQWLFLCDMLNSTVIDENSGQYLWADIAESGKLDGLAEKWELDGEQFSAQVRAMTPASVAQLLDVVSKFWKSPKLNTIDRDDLLRECGAIMK